MKQRRIEENKEAEKVEQDEERKENDNSMKIDQAILSIRNLNGRWQGNDHIYF